MLSLSLLEFWNILKFLTITSKEKHDSNLKKFKVLLLEIYKFKIQKILKNRR